MKYAQRWNTWHMVKTLWYWSSLLHLFLRQCCTICDCALSNSVHLSRSKTVGWKQISKRLNAFCSVSNKQSLNYRTRACQMHFGNELDSYKCYQFFKLAPNCIKAGVLITKYVFTKRSQIYLKLLFFYATTNEYFCYTIKLLFDGTFYTQTYK